jgi:hypothetical protein
MNELEDWRKKEGNGFYSVFEFCSIFTGFASGSVGFRKGIEAIQIRIVKK